MNLNNNVDGVIFSDDITFAYNVRNVCSESGVYLDYSQTGEDLILYVIRNKGGLIFIDHKRFSYMDILKEYLNSEKSKNFTFIIITDSTDIDFEITEKAYITNFENIREVLPKIKYLNSFYKDITSISKSEIYKNIIGVLELYGISPKHIGYLYIKECVALGVESNTGVLNFSINIYPIIASKFNTCTGNVDKNIRTAIKKAYENNPKLFDIDDVCHRAITNAGFLNYIIEKVKMKCIECSA